MYRLILLTALLAAPALPQKPFVPPTLKGERNVRVQAAASSTDDIIGRYNNRHEAAIAALKAGNQVASLSRADDRVINLFLIATKRDPSYPLALYNLAVMCAKGERWEDSISFYKEAAKADPGPEMAKLTSEELERVKLLAELESTSDGKRRRQFDIEFVDLLKHTSDPVPALELLNHAAKTDGSRWETPALRGVLEAALGHYSDSLHALESAAKIAPADRRPRLTEAAELARHEANFEELVRNGDLAMESQEYEKSGKLYASAWEITPSRAQVGMQAAVGFLMADQIPLAVEVLQRLKQSPNPDYSRKAAAMLKELAAVSDSAAKPGPANRSSETEAQTLDTAARIQKSVGDLLSPQMKIETRALPKLLEDKTPFTALPDPELDARDLGMLSSASIFLKYQEYAAAAPAVQAPPDATPPSAEPAAGVTVPASPAPPSPMTVTPADTPGRPPRLETRRFPASGDQPPVGNGVSITSDPPGALVTFDKDPSVTCITPCSTPFPPGRHTFEVSKAGYRNAARIAVVEKSGAPSFAVSLELKQGTVEVTSAVPGAAIYVDGKKTDKITPARLMLPEGEHDIAIEVGGAPGSAQHVPIKDGDGYQIKF